VTRQLTRESRDGSRRQIGVQTWLTFVDRLDTTEMKRARKKLAVILTSYDRTKHNKVNEAVLDFFEDMGTVYELGFLDHKLADSTFGYYATHWWEAAKAYVDQERRNMGGDKADDYFGYFQRLAEKLRYCDIDDKAVQAFLKEEGRLNVD
jgi:nucleoside 2-deoxyribosyltransferase